MIEGLPEGATLKPIEPETPQVATAQVPNPSVRKIEGLPEGATVKPIEGLPEGATVKPITQVNSAPANDASATAPPAGAKPAATPAAPPTQDEGYFKGLWDSTLGPVWEQAKAKSDAADKLSFTERLKMGVKEGLQSTPPQMAVSLISHAIEQAYEQGKKAVHHAGQAASEIGEEGKSLLKGDIEGAAAHGKAATGEMSEAGGHGLAAVVPVVGPAAAEAGEDIGGGKPRQGLGKATGIIGSMVAPELLTRGAGALATKVTKNVETAANVSKTEAAAATARQAANDATGEAAAANVKAEAGRPTLEAHATAEGAVKTAKQEVSKTSAAENSASGKLDSAKKGTAEANNALAAERTAEQLRTAAAKESQTQTKVNQVASRRVIGNTARQSAEKAIDEINTAREGAPGHTPIDSKSASATATSFGEAADVIQSYAKEIYEKLDKVSNGQFTSLREIIKANKKAIYESGDKNAVLLQKRFDQDMEALFTKHAADIGPNDLKAATAAWRTSKVLEEIHTAVERSITGAPETIANRAGTSREVIGAQLNKRLNKLLENVSQGDIEKAIGKDGLNNLYRVAELTSTPAKAAKLTEATQNVARSLKLEARATEAAKSEATAAAAVKSAAEKASAAKSALAAAETAEKQAAAAAKPTVEMQNKVRELKAKAKVLQAEATKASEAAAAAKPAKESVSKAIVSHLTTKTIASSTGAAVAHGLGIDPRLGAIAGLSAEAAGRAVLQRALTSPRVGKMLQDAISVGANAKIYGPLIAQAIRAEAEGNETESKRATAKK